MSWITSREAVIAQTLSEVMEGVHKVRPNLHLQVDASSPFALGKNLTTRLNNEIITLEKNAYNLTIELNAADQRAVEQKKEEEARHSGKDIAAIQISELKTRLIQVEFERDQARAPTQDQEVRIVLLEAELMEAQVTIDELNRLTARQHQQLIELLGKDFDRP